MYLFVKYLKASNLEPPAPLLYNTYKLGVFKVIDNYTGNSQLSANTGLTFDKNRRLIYSAITPINADNTGLKIFNENYEFQGLLPIISVQGFTYDPILDQFMVWSQGGVNSTFKTYAYDGTLLYTQSNFDPFGNGTRSGSVCYDYDTDEILLSSDGIQDIAILVRDGDNWVFDRFLGAVDPEEGITYDDVTGTYWYERVNHIVNISKQGAELKVIPQPEETATVNEGLAFNPFRRTLYINSDKGYHGGIENGNRMVEVYPDFI